MSQDLNITNRSDLKILHKDHAGYIVEDSKGNRQSIVEIETFAQDASEIFGSHVTSFQNMISGHINGLLLHQHFDELDLLSHAQATSAALKGIAPQDPIEGMLAAQMVAVYKASMECLKRGMQPNQTPKYLILI